MRKTVHPAHSKIMRKVNFSEIRRSPEKVSGAENDGAIVVDYQYCARRGGVFRKMFQNPSSKKIRDFEAKEPLASLIEYHIG